MGRLRGSQGTCPQMSRLSSRSPQVFKRKNRWIKYFYLILKIADPESQTAEKSKFLTGFSKDVTEHYNILHLDELGPELAEKVLQYWMSKINRQLTNFQVINMINVILLRL